MREILDREPGRVEQRDVAGASAAVRVSHENGAEVGDVVATDHAGIDGTGELTAVARLLPVVAEEVRAAEFLDGDLGLSGPVGSHQRDVLARLERARGIEDVGARGHRDHDLARERLRSIRCNASTEPFRNELGAGPRRRPRRAE